MKRLYSLKVCLAALVLILATTSSPFAYIDGDVDGDGFVRMDDALLVIRYFAGTQACNSSCGYPFECPYLINMPSCSKLEFSCMAIQNEFNQNLPYCFITGGMLILKRAQGLI